MSDLKVPERYRLPLSHIQKITRTFRLMNKYFLSVLLHLSCVMSPFFDVIIFSHIMVISQIINCHISFIISHALYYEISHPQIVLDHSSYHECLLFLYNSDYVLVLLMYIYISLPIYAETPLAYINNQSSNIREHDPSFTLNQH